MTEINVANAVLKAVDEIKTDEQIAHENTLNNKETKK